METTQQTNDEKRMVEININPSRLEKLITTMEPVIYDYGAIPRVRLHTDLKDLTRSENRLLELIAARIKYNKETGLFCM